MPNKYQVGTVGGIRKVINVKAAASTATTIEGLENTSITLAQLKTLLGNTTTVQPSNPGTPSAGAQTLTVTNGTTSVSNVTTLEVPAAVNVSAPGGNIAALTLPSPLTVTDGTHNVTAVSNLLFQNSVNVSSTTAGDAIVIMLPSLKVTDGSTLATSIGEIIFSGASVSTTSTNTSAVTVTITNGGSITVTDGSTNVTGVTKIVFSGASVSTTGANEATVTVTGGSSNPFNITPDTHATLPTGVGIGPNDEFEGATLDTAGTRYSGATAWTWQQQGSSAATLSEGALALAGQLVSSNTISAIEQPLSGSSWTFQAKCSFQAGLGGNSSPFAGLHLRETSSGKITGFGFFATDLGQLILATGTLTGGYSNVAVNSNCAYFPSGGIGSYITPYLYYQISRVSGNIVYSFSQSGLPGTFLGFTSRALTTDFTTAPDQIGFVVRANNTTDTPIVNADWFRRIS